MTHVFLMCCLCRLGWPGFKKNRHMHGDPPPGFSHSTHGK
jgi:hypothetical protein